MGFWVMGISGVAPGDPSRSPLGLLFAPFYGLLTRRAVCQALFQLNTAVALAV